MNIIGIGINIKNSVEAVGTYKKAFSLELGYHVLNDDGTYFHSELYDKAGDEKLSVVEADAPICEYNPVQLCFTFETEQELASAFNILRDGGKILMDICELPWSPCAAEVTDKFGVRWYLTVPQHRPPDSFTPSDCN